MENRLNMKVVAKTLKNLKPFEPFTEHSFSDLLDEMLERFNYHSHDNSVQDSWFYGASLPRAQFIDAYTDELLKRLSQPQGGDAHG